MPFGRAVSLAIASILAAGLVCADESKTVLGPVNQPLYDGAAALLAGDAEEGVRLTLKGLERTTRDKDRIAAWSNLCAGYAMLERYEDALAYCNRVLEFDDDSWRAYNNRAVVYIGTGDYGKAKADIGRAESIAPRARKVRQTKLLLQNALEPVAPTVIIDDRRRDPDDAKDP